MSLLVDVFGFLTIIVHGLTIIAQSMMVSGVLFLLLLARPLRALPQGGAIIGDTTRIAGWAALALIACDATNLALQTSVLMDTVDLPFAMVMGAGFAEAGLVKIAAASLTSVPPAVDLTRDRVTWPEIEARNTPVWPRLASPDHDALTLPALQAQFDAEAAAHAQAPQPAFVPGSGDIPARNAEDIAWSEYNHHWAGIFVALIGLLALLNQAGVRWARHWPLAFLGLAAFLFLRSDPEVWPLGAEGFFASLRDVEVLQHRFFVLLVALFALFEWRVRVGAWISKRARMVFPLLTAVGGAALLTHTHAIANVKDQLLIELSHTPLALASIAAGWSRWLEIRLDGRGARIAGWAWPPLIGLILLSYREA